jgi:2'-5' RNA ligase
MQKRKIFIEIEIPKAVKRKISQKILMWQDLPVKWTKEDNLHLTVSFIGYVDESVIPDICQKVSEAVSQLDAFDLELNHIELGPKEKDPNVIWLTGQASEDLKELNEAVEKALGTFSQSHKIFKPHLTLGKIRKAKWDELAEKPEIAEKFHAIIPVDGVSIMESRGGGADYFSVEECPLA